MESAINKVLGLLFSILSLSAFSQNSFQKILYPDSCGFFGITAKPDTSYLVGCQTLNAFKIIKVDKFGSIQSASECNDTLPLYMQLMLALSDGSTLLIGRLGDAGLVIKLNNQDQVEWSRTLEIGFTTGDSWFFYDAAEDTSGIIYLLLSRGSLCGLLGIDPQGDLLWSRYSQQYYFTALAGSEQGGCYLAGVLASNTGFLWKINANGDSTRYSSFQLLEPQSMLRDILELPNHHLMLLFQEHMIDEPSDYILASLNLDWEIVWARKYSCYSGFYDVNTLLQTSENQVAVLGCIYNADTASYTFPGFKIFQSRHDTSGQLFSCHRYYGGRSRSGLSQAVVCPDQGMLISGYICDSASFPYFPYLVKTDELGLNGCYTDTINLTCSDYPLVAGNQYNPLLTFNDSLNPLSLTLNSMIQTPFTTLCYTGIETGEDNPDVDIFPNPASGILKLLWEKSAGLDLSIEIFNISGQLIKQVRANPLQDALAIDVSSLTPGCYCIRLVFGQKVSYRKFIKN
jgi:hypothetical protein